MCFHNAMSAKAVKLAARYGKKTDVLEIVEEIISEKYHINAFDFPECPIVTNNPSIQLYNWGLIPHTTKNEVEALRIRKMTLNARAETLFERKSYQEPILHKRCLIPSTGFFEYHHNSDRTKTPYFIHLKDTYLFSIAGIFDTWCDSDSGTSITTFSMITTDANELMRNIHNGGNHPYRMPAIILPENEDKWLNPELSKTEIMQLLKPIDSTLMDAYIVNKDFYKKENAKNPNIIKPIN